MKTEYREGRQMAFELIHKPTFASQLLLIDSNQVKHILQKIEDLRTDPTPAGNHKKPLKGNRYRGVFRLRYGKYRVLYTYSEQERWVTLLGVDTRDDVYRGDELVEAEEPDIDVKRLPSMSDLLGPATIVTAPNSAPAAPPSAGDPLPIALTEEVLDRLYIAPQYWPALIACQTFDELAAAPIPSIVQIRIKPLPGTSETLRSPINSPLLPSPALKFTQAPSGHCRQNCRQVLPAIARHFTDNQHGGMTHLRAS
jgi:mRNA-degrading endonuclease RelE of RelBE toxin-antitoxin system